MSGFLGDPTGGFVADPLGGYVASPGAAQQPTLPTSVLTPQEFAAAYGLVPPPPSQTPAVSNVSYTANYGDRWDTVAYKLYGDPTQVEPLIAANPTVMITCQLMQGTVLYGPILTPTSTAATTTPWQP